jgi:hypothetical protein
MGNSLRQEMIESENNFNVEERKALKSIFKELSSVENGNNPETKFIEIFNSINVPDFSRLCYRYVCGTDSLTYEKFLDFVNSGTRSSPNATINMIWNILRLGNESTSEKILHNFFLLLLEFGGCDASGVNTSAQKMLNHVKNHTLKNSNKMGSPIDEIGAKELLCWSNEFAPCMSKIFSSFLNNKCLSRVELMTAVPFRSPLLDSSVVTQSDIFPLALYNDGLQGNWYKLYTTDCDGLSFNRIAHHILGYKVTIYIHLLLHSFILQYKYYVSAYL